MFFSKGASEEFRGRRDIGDVLGIPQPIRYHPGGHYERRIALEHIVLHILETFIALHGNMVFVTLEGDRVVAPEAREKMKLNLLLDKTMLVVMNFIFIKIALKKNADLFTFQAHNCSPSVLTGPAASHSLAVWLPNANRLR